MSTERLIYLPLGGAGEIGMNAYVYGYGKPGKERLIVVDLGVAFPDMDTSPGVDLIIADIDWLVKRKKQIEAIFVTHAHEDHVGGIAHTYDRLQAPIFARKFTANITKRKMSEYNHPDDAVTIVGTFPHQVEAGPFKVGFQPISHSIPESSALIIDTPAGRIVHSGDFKVDLTPGVGEAFDPAAFEEIAKDGIKALVCDSTNVFSQEAGRSEATLPDAITELVAGASGMVVATTFASNVARVKTLAVAGQKAGRSVVLLGRAMKRMVEASVETGVLTDFPPTISPEQARDVPRENLLLLVTGSQGERRAASAQLARGKYMGRTMQEGDMVLFSSKTIPGNEKGVIRIMNQFSEIGVDVVDDSSGKYHVSGHANRPDIETLHDLLKPQAIIPMHGEHRHLREHVKIANGKGYAGVMAVNGMMIDLSGNAPKVAEYVETGRTYLDGSCQVGALDGVVRDRIRMALNGHMTVTILMDENDEALGDPWVDTMGLPEKGVSNTTLTDVVEHDLGQWLGRVGAKTLRDDKALDDGLRKVARQSSQNEIGKKPEVTVVVSRLS